MRVSISKNNHYWVLSCSGSTVNLPSGTLFDVSVALTDGARDIILDFKNLKFLGSAGVKMLQDTVREVRSYGGHLGIASPNPFVRRQIKLHSLNQEIPVYFNVEEAVARLDLMDYQPELWQDQADLLLIWQKDLPIAVEMRKAVKEHRSTPWFRLRPVHDLEELIEALKSDIAGCILVDSTIPIFKIAGLMEYLRSETWISSIPVLVVSKDDRLSEAQIMIGHGAHELLSFPIAATEAVIRINNVISYFKDHTPYYPPGKAEHAGIIRR